MPWNPEQYHRFQAQRSAPFEDAIKLVRIRTDLRVVDLGCGTGELTRRLADALPNSQVVGLDSSPEMLAKAEEHARSRLRFEQGDLSELTGVWDLIFSHAAIQWVDDHESLIPRLLSQLTPGGQLVIQLPSNHTHITHRAITELASEEPFRSALSGWVRQWPTLSIEGYAQLLYDSGAQDLVVFEKIYPHVLADADALVEWTRGTALVPYLDRLDAELQQQFLERYRAMMRSAFPQRPVFYGFRRTLFAATRPS